MVLTSCDSKSLTIARTDQNVLEVNNSYILNGTYSAKKVNTNSNWTFTCSDPDEFDLGDGPSEGEWLITFEPTQIKEYWFKFSVDGCASNTIKVNVSAPIPTLTLVATSPTSSTFGPQFNITGTYTTQNFDDLTPNLELYGADSAAFSDFSIDQDDFAFECSLHANTAPGDYKLQLRDIVTNTISNFITITITGTMPEYKNTSGSDWDGMINGTIGLELNNAEHTAKIDVNSGITTNNLVIPQYVSPDNGVNIYTITSIDNDAFLDGTGLSGTITFPQSITHIGAHSFANCTNLSGTLTLPNNLQEISYGAFQNCTNLTGTLVIPNTVTSIGPYAFCLCSGMTGNLHLSSQLEQINLMAFAGSGFTGGLAIPTSVNQIFSNAFDSTNFNSIFIPSSVTNIAAGAFANCNNVAELVLHDFTSTPPWQEVNIFADLGQSVPEYENKNVKISNGWGEAQNAKTFLVARGLPSEWNVIIV